MAILEKYRYYFNIDPEYVSAINEAAINANPDLWKKFFPHETFVKLLKNTVNVLDRKQRLSIWVEGAYGTGKSHAVLTLKKLLDASYDDTKAYFEKYGLDNDLCNNLQRIKNEGKILTVHRYGSSTIHDDQDLVLAVQESIEHAFDAAGIKNKGADSLKESVIRYLSDFENKQSFGIYVNGSYSDLFGGDDVDGIIEKLKIYEGAALHSLMEKIFKVAKERQIKVFTMSCSDLACWIKETIKANDLKAIVFIWDEFTEYFYNNARNMTGFQEIVEISETDPFYFILVTHVSSGLFPDSDRDFIKLNGRFVNPHSRISLPEHIAFQLMGAAMEKNNDTEVAADWSKITDDLQNRTKESRKLVKSVARIGDEELRNIVPIHPYTALLLKHISSAFDSNQRSMFDFIKNDRGDEIKGFQWFIDNNGPDDNPLLTVDMLWEFFYDKGKEFLAHNIRSVLDYFARSANKRLADDEKRVLKTVLLLQAISQNTGDSVELFIPDEKNINNAFEGSDLDGAAGRCAEKLVRDKVLFKKKISADKYQYNAYVNEVSGAELDKFKEEIDRKPTSSLINEPLFDKSTVSDAISLSGALKLRYEIKCVSADDFDMQIKQLRNREELYENKIVAVICFAKDDNESFAISKKIKAAVEDGSYNMIFIDATTTPFGKDGYSQYRDDMAQSMYQLGKDNTLATQYSSNAKESLKKWKIRVQNGEFIVTTKEKITGERITTIDALYAYLAQIDRMKFPECAEATYNVIANMWTMSNLKQGAECGAEQKTAGTYRSDKVNSLEDALSGAWGVENYWIERPNLHISRLKQKIDSVINETFESKNRISIREIYDVLKAAPYGFMPCNLTAFMMGFLLKEYVNGSFSWSDGLTSDALDVVKLKEMIAEIINLQITPNVRYKDKYIVAMTDDEKAFNETTAVAFDISKNLCTSVEQTRERIRSRMKEFSFPIWTIKSILSKYVDESDITVIADLIDYYCGMANSNNISGSKTDSEIAMAIGKLCTKNRKAPEILKSVLTKEKCVEGMHEYLNTFEDGILPKLAAEVGDNGQYINVVRRKFDADAANWVWSVETVQQKIKEVILEYRIIAESNKVIDKTTAYDNTISEWCDKCQYIRISYAAAKNNLDELGPFLGMLCDMKKSGHLPDSQKDRFLKLLVRYGSEFLKFRNNQVSLFKKICVYYLDGLDDEEIRSLYQTIPAGTFTYEKSEYMNLVDKNAQEFRSNLDNVKLRKLWEEKTETASPREWSKKHKMPILCIVDSGELQRARKAFETINKNHPDAVSVADAIDYIQNATFFNRLNDKEYLDKMFTDTIIKECSTMLTDIDEVKRYLGERLTSEPYDWWFDLPEVEKKLKLKAEATYIQYGCDKALEIIDGMDINDVKRYLKELIKDNMIVGMQIIKGK